MKKIALIRTFLVAVVTLTAIVAMNGCSDSERPQATGKGSIRGINAIVDSPELTFLIEELSLGAVAYKSASAFTEYDDLTYNFNFDVFLPGNSSRTRVATQFVDVIVDMEYTLILSGSFTNPSISIQEDARRTFADADTIFEAEFIHQAPSQGEFDVYFATTGTVPLLGQAIGTLSSGERISYQEFPDGNYELIITPKDDPNTFVFQTDSIASFPATRVAFAIFDPDPSITSVIAVNLINANGSSAPLFDVNSISQIRLFHAAFGAGNVDGFLNNDFSIAAFPDVGFGQLSNYVDTDLLLQAATVTPAGNAGAPILEQNIGVAANSRKTIVFGGNSGTPIFLDLVDDARPISAFPSARVTNMSANANTVNIYLLEAGTTITEDTIFLFASVPYPFTTGFFVPDSGNMEMTITAAGELTPISAPLPIDLQNGDIVDIIILDTADPTLVELATFDSQLVNP